MTPGGRRFRSAAAHYPLGRPGYPSTVIAAVAGLCGLDRSHRLLDLGCGPAPLAIAFSSWVGSVLAVDPEPEMLRLAREAVRSTGSVPVEVREGSSESLGPDWGTFRAVMLGRAFHWMDRSETLRRLDALVDPGGAVVLFHDQELDLPENVAVRAWRAVVERHAQGDLARAQRHSSAWEPHGAILARSPFSRVDSLVQIHRAGVTVESLVHRALSMSSTAPDRLGEAGTARLTAEIHEALAPFDRAGTLSETLEWTATVAHRP